VRLRRPCADIGARAPISAHDLGRARRPAHDRRAWSPAVRCGRARPHSWRSWPSGATRPVRPTGVVPVITVGGRAAVSAAVGGPRTL